MKDSTGESKYLNSILLVSGKFYLFILENMNLTQNARNTQNYILTLEHIWFTQTAQTHADFIVSHGNHGMHRKASRYASHHAEVGASGASKIL